MTIDKQARSTADFALLVANKAKKGIKGRQAKNISVGSQSAMLALTNVYPGQVVIREDDGYYNYFLKALPANSLANWQPMGKDAPPIGETVEDIITTNEVITSKADGLYAFTGTPNGGFPAGVTQGDIAQKTGSVWTVVYTFINAPASIYAKSDGQTYDKKVNSSNVNNWVAKPKPAYYEIGSNKEFSTINSSFAQFITDGVSVGVGQLYDSEFNERVIFPANAQNFLLKGEGYVTRNNNLVNNIEILGHRFTLQKCQPNCNVSLANVSKTVTTTLNSKTIVITGAGQTTSGLVKYQKITGTGIPAMSYIDTIIDSTTFTISQNATANGTNITTTIQPKAPIVIDSSGTITEAGQPNIKRGKHCFDDLSFSTPGASAIDIFDIGHFADFRNCNFANKEINLYTTSTTPVYITFTNCQAGVINIYSPFIVVTKTYSPSVVFKTIISQVAIVDFDKATPVAYSLLRQYSLGQTVSVPLGAMIINDDVGATLQMLKCTTAYTIPVTINTGTPIDLTKYQVGANDASQVSISGTFTPTNSSIVSGDNLKSALEKTQGQIDNFAFSNFSIASPIYGDSIIFENMLNAIATPAIFSQAAGSTNQIYQGATVLTTSGTGYNNTAGVGGHTITVPAGFNQILVRVLGDRDSAIELDKFNGVSWTTVGRRQYYRASGISKTTSPTGSFAKFTINRDYHVAWLPLYCPDSLGGTYMIRFTNNNPSPVIASSSAGDGKWMSGFAITKNNKGLAYSQSLEVHWRSHGNVTPLLNGATWGNQPTYNSYDGNSLIYNNYATNSFCDFPLPQIPNGKDKLFWMILYGGAEYSAPKSLRVNNQEVATSSFNGGENFIQWLEMQKASVVDIYKNLNFSNCGLIGCKVPAAIMGNNVYSHCRLSWTGAGSVSYFSDIGTLDLI